MTHPAISGPLEQENTPAYFDEALCDAERLLKYAAEIGIDVTGDTRGAILLYVLVCGFRGADHPSGSGRSQAPTPVRLG